MYVTVEDAPNESLIVHWTFTFDDLGLFHSLSSSSYLEMPDLFGPLLVDGVPFDDIQQAEEAIFGGDRYPNYVRILYDQVSPSGPLYPPTFFLLSKLTPTRTQVG